MRMKGKLIKWNTDKAFGFIQPNGGGDHVFIHKTALSNRSRTPHVNDVITFSIAKDNQGRYCAGEATFSGEKPKKKQAKKVSKFSIYLAVLFLGSISIAFFFNHIPKNLLFAYLGLSVVTFLAYWIDKSKAQRGVLDVN
jgi:cold shock CspA family protein